MNEREIWSELIGDVIELVKVNKKNCYIYKI